MITLLRTGWLLQGAAALAALAAVVLSSGHGSQPPEPNPPRSQDSREACLAAYRRGEALLKQSRLAEAASAYETAVNLAPAAFGELSSETANIVNNLGFIYQRLAQYDKAEPLYVRGLHIREKTFGPEHPQVASSLNSLGNLYGAMGRFRDAETALVRSRRIREARQPGEPALAMTLNNLGLLYKDLGRYEKALDCYQAARGIFEAKLPNSPQLATTLDNLIEIHLLLDQAPQAFPLQQRCLKMFEDNLGPDHPETAICLQNIGFALHRKLRLLERAEPYYLRALKIQEQKLPSQHPSVANTLNNLGTLYQAMGDTARAQQLLQRSWEIRQKLPAGHPLQVGSLNNLAFLYEEMGQMQRAEALYKQCLEKVSDTNPIQQSTTLTNLAHLYLLQADYARAEPLVRRSLELRKNVYGPDHPEVAQNLGNLALIRAAAGQWDEAARLADANLRILRRHLSRTFSVLTDREQAGYLQSLTGEFHTALSAAQVARGEAAFAERSAGWVLNFKAVAQQALAERALLGRAERRADLAPAVEQLRAVRRRLAALAFRAHAPDGKAAQRERLIELYREEQDLSRLLAQAIGGPAGQDPWVELADVRAGLPADAVLVEVVRFRAHGFEGEKRKPVWRAPRYAAWVISPRDAGPVRLIDLGEAEALEEAVWQARRVLQAGPRREKEEWIKPLQAVSDLVLKPLLPHLGRAERWLISADGDLWLVPWAALPLPGDAKNTFAVEKHRISFLVTGRDLVRAFPAVPATAPAIFAAPDYDLGPEEAATETRRLVKGERAAPRVLSGALAGAKWQALPGTEEEARAIRPALDRYAQARSRSYLGRQALEGVFRATANPRVLVLSTHGFFLEDQDFLSGEAADRGLEWLRPRLPRPAPKRPAGPTGGRLENPLLRCGLVLAGANRRAETAAEDGADGILTGLEVLDSDLRGTELVVLSACETGLGQVHNGEGVAGLRQAFQLAGARAVLASLWRIPDRETVPLMTTLMDGMAQGEGPADALRAAQLSVIEARRRQGESDHPYFWAAFTLTGRWQSKGTAAR
jgi:CHAT domain-containing protein/tetratricopeptide (TPR) repeat protein